MPTFISLGKADGGLDMSEYQRTDLRRFIKKNAGQRLRLLIEKVTPESSKQRAFYHGAVIPLIAYYQEGMNYRNSTHLEEIHEWLKLEFNGIFVTVKGKSQKVGKTTKGALNQYIERVMDWMAEQGYKMENLNPEEYKIWRDTVFPWGGPDNYIDYLRELNRL